MSAERTLVVGLGNPGPKYARTRHNAGWLVIDSLVRSLGAEQSHRADDREPSDQWRADDTLLVKPTTFMNGTGPEVRRIMEYYKIPADRLLVVTDELDLPFGTVQLRPSGGSAGHKGMEGVIASVGTQEFARIRLGIGRPPEGKDATDFVLSPFDSAEAEELPGIVANAADQAKGWLGV